MHRSIHLKYLVEIFMVQNNAETDGNQDAKVEMFPISLNETARAQGNWQTKLLTEPELDQLLGTHTLGEKDGDCAVFARLKNSTRNIQSVETVSLWYADLDSGQSEDEIRAALEAEGLQAWVYSTFSHLTTKFDKANKAAWDGWKHANPKGTVGVFLEHHHGFVRSVVENAKIVGEFDEHRTYRYKDNDGNTRTETRSLTRLRIEHAPCPKFRVVGVLSVPWQSDKHDVRHYKGALGALLRRMGLRYDPTSVDVARLHYLPRVKVLTGHEVAFKLHGSRFDWEAQEIDTYCGGPGGAGRGVRGLVSGSTSGDDDLTFTNPKTGKVHDLKKWAGLYGHRFKVVSALKERSAWLFAGRKVLEDDYGGRTERYYLNECPNEEQHTTATTGDDVWVADAFGSEGFGFYCHHNHCLTLDGYSRDRLFFLRRMLEQGWLTAEDMADERFMLDKSEADELYKNAKRQREFGQPVESDGVGRAGDYPDGRIDGQSGSGNQAEHKDAWWLGTEPLYDPLQAPGLVGTLTRWGYTVAFRDTPVPSFVGSLMGVSLAMGPVFRDHKVLHRKSQRGNLYALLCAETGVGKDDMADVMAKCAEIAGQQHLMDDVRSWPGVHSKMHRLSRSAHGARGLMFFDEYGQVLRALKVSKESHLHEFQRQMLSQFTKSRISEASLANVSHSRPAVENSYMPFLGGTQPEVWAESLPDNAFASGGMNRTLCFFVSGVPEERPFDENNADGDSLPDDAVRALEWLWGAEGRLAFAGEPEIRLLPSEGAKDVLKTFHKDCENLRKLLARKGDPRKDALLRGLQLAKRVSLVLAAGEAAEDPSRLDDLFAPKFYVPLSEATAIFAVNIVRQCLRDLLHYAKGNLGITAEAKLADRILKWMQAKTVKSTGMFKRRDVQRGTMSGTERSYEWSAAWDRLLDVGSIVQVSEKEAPSGGAWYRVV